jgi:hypothetical protein
MAILNRQKCHLKKIKENRRCRTGPAWRSVTSVCGEDVGRGCKRVNMVQILCTHVSKWKNETVETIPGMGGRG